MMPFSDPKTLRMEQSREGNEAFYCGHVDFEMLVNI